LANDLGFNHKQMYKLIKAGVSVEVEEFIVAAHYAMKHTLNNAKITRDRCMFR
jgi:hypothetical protein